MNGQSPEIEGLWSDLDKVEANGHGKPTERVEDNLRSPEVAKDASRLSWSVVIITRNEAANTAACLESVLYAFDGRDVEIVLVDSASTDDTVEIARRFPIRTICLPPSKHLNPSIGRATGFAHTTGEYVLFLDGDCILDSAWVAPAEQALAEDPSLGGIAGASFGLLPPDADGVRQVQDEYPRADYDNPTYLAGSAAYRREVLDKVGCFNPNLHACEEEEFGARVRKGGWRMRRLRQTMSQHHPKHAKETTSELIRRFRRRYFIGLGQLVRHTIAHELPIGGILTTVNRHIVYFSMLLAGAVAAVAAALFATPAPVLSWLAGMTLAFAAFAVKSRGIRKPAYYFLEWTLASPMVMLGLAMRPVGSEERRPGLDPVAVHEPSQG